MAAPCAADDAAERPWRQTGTLAAPEVVQAAAADDDFVYAVANTLVAKYDRKTGKRVAVSEGQAKHLNSGFFWKRRLYCAHSNYPQKPEIMWEFAEATRGLGDRPRSPRFLS